MPRHTHYSEEEADERRSSDEKGNDSISSDTTLLLNDAEFVKWKQRGDSGLKVDYLDTAESHRHRGHYRHLTSLLFLVSACLNVYLAFGRTPRVLTMHDVDVGCGAFPLGTDPSGYVPRSKLSTPVQRNQKDLCCGVTVSMTDKTNQILGIHFAGPSGMRKTNFTYPPKPSTAGRTYKNRQSA